MDVIAIKAENQIPHRFVFLGKTRPPIDGVHVRIGRVNLPIEVSIECRGMNAVAPYGDHARRYTESGRGNRIDWTKK